MRNRFGSILTILSLVTAAVLGDDTPPRLPLDELLETPISTAAKYDQQLSSVAASVTVITAEEITRYGWTTLDEAIQSVRGMFVTNDRNNSHFGIRGIGRPGDFNVRMLVLLDGQRMNGSVWGEGAMTGPLALDMQMIEKIEIVRGPGSALYGSHAMLAVINIITKRADELDGLSLSAMAGSRGKRELSLRSGRELANGIRLVTSAHWSSTAGSDLFFPEFEEPGVSDGFARGRDYENAFNVGMGLERNGLRVDLSTRSRTKGDPTASFGTIFNTDTHSTNTRDLAVITYNRSAGRGKTVEVRGYWNRSRTRGEWIYDATGIDHTEDARWGGEARLHWDVSPNQRLTVGTEVVDHLRAEYRYAVGDYNIAIGKPFTESSYYVQHEYHPTPALGFVTGVRHDRFSTAPSSTNPRLAAIITPNRNTTFKLLYGTAFLAPSVYQLQFADPETPWKVNPSLQPETVRTLELVWEQRLSREVFVVGTAYRINSASLIESEVDPRDSVVWYQNLGSIGARGAEVGVDWRKANGLWANLNYAIQHAHAEDDHLDNSPQHILKAALSTSPWNALHGGIEAQYESGRNTRSGLRTEGAFLLNATLSRKLSEHLRLSITARNLLGARYFHPVGAEVTPDAVEQNGRTITFKLAFSR